MRKWFPAVALLLAVGLSIATYPQLPDPVQVDLRPLLPVDAGGDGELVPKPVVAFGLPMIGLLLFALLHEAPIRPLGRATARLMGVGDAPVEYHKFAPSYRLIVGWVVMLIVAMHGAVLSNALAWRIEPGLFVGAVFGLGLVIVGNVMPRLRPNAVAGIRTARTMRDPQLWARVHRLYGAFWVIAGVIVLIVAALAPRYALLAGVAALLVSSLALLAIPPRLLMVIVVILLQAQ